MRRRRAEESNIEKGYGLTRRTFLFAGLGCTAMMAGCGGLQVSSPKEWRPGMTTERRVELALKRFKEGFHCSQCVLEPFAADFGLTPQTSRRLSAPLAGGTIPGGECGAVGSGYLILGLRFGSPDPLTPDGKGHTAMMNMYSRIHHFVQEFRARHGALSCTELTGVDVFTLEGRKLGRETGAFDNCGQYIADAIGMIDDLLV